MGLEFIYTDSQYVEKGFLKNPIIDLEIGKYNVSSNDFEITLSIADRDEFFNIGSLFYSENTEYGGLVEQIKVSTSENAITFTGKTFRGLLEKEYIQPPEGETHLKLRGDANECINALIGNKFGDLFVVDEIGESGITINYDVRDLNLLDAIEKALKKSNAKINIQYQADGKVHLKAVMIEDLSDIIQYDNNYKLAMIVQTQPKQYNHILALGKGELLDRLRVNLYLQKDGSWVKDSEYYIGLDKKSYKYEDVNTEEESDLIENAIKNVTDSIETENLDITFESDNAELFDIVGAKEQITDISFKQPITQKILKVQDNETEISYKVGD